MSPTPLSTHPLEFLIGTWVGKGHGFYPTIREFHFLDEITFSKDPTGQPVVAYSERAFRAIPDPNGEPTRGPPYMPKTVLFASPIGPIQGVNWLSVCPQALPVSNSAILKALLSSGHLLLSSALPAHRLMIYCRVFF